MSIFWEKSRLKKSYNAWAGGGGGVQLSPSKWEAKSTQSFAVQGWTKMSAEMMITQFTILCWELSAHTHIHVHTWICVYIQPPTHMYIHMYTHTHIYIHIRTWIYESKESRREEQFPSTQPLNLWVRYLEWGRDGQDSMHHCHMTLDLLSELSNIT